MGAVTSLKLPQGFCFSKPDSTHDLLLPYLQVLSTSKASVVYSTVPPTNPATYASIWVKSTETNTGTLEVYIRTQKYATASSDEWCRYYPYSIGDIEMCDRNFLDETEIETARSTSTATRNYRPFAVCDGGTYGGFATPDLSGKILFGGYCGNSDATKETVQVNEALKTQAPFASATDLATASGMNAHTPLDPFRMYVESGDEHNTSALLDAGTSVRTFKVGQPVPSNRQGARGVVLKRDQVPDHTHRYGWETWKALGNRVAGSQGSAAIYTNVTERTATSAVHNASSSASLTLGRPHDNLPPVFTGIYRIYIGYGT